MKHLTKEEKDDLKGKRIKLIKMDDPYSTLKPGALGTCTGVDDAGHVQMKWDEGSSLSLIPDADKWEVIEESKNVMTFEKFTS